MIVYFSATGRNIKEDIATYKRIIHAVREADHNVSNDWTENALLREPNSYTNMPALVSDSIKAIENAELLIAEASGVSTLGVGYEIALALHHKKPTLILVREDMEGISYAVGLKDDLITPRTYNDETLEKIVTDFLKDNEVKNKDLRFNFVIDRKIYNHLRLKSFQTGKTKAEVVRDLLLKDLDKDPKS
jgi:hypothetical protein